jgi:IS5 family transposase
VARLVRALVVKSLLNLSLRELEQAIGWNLLVKWFVGYAVFEAGPDHTTLERFEQWVERHQARTFFDQVLAQIDRFFPEDRGKAQMGDTYAMRANAAPESLIRLIRHTCQRLLARLGEIDAESLASVESQLDRAALFGVTDETKEYRLDKIQRQQRLQATVIAALQCQASVLDWLAGQCDLGDSHRQGLERWLEILDKILADELRISSDEEEITAVQELPKGKKGSYRITSATDPDATYRVHGEAIDFGYNVNVAATDTFIREIRADTGCQPDAAGIADLLQAQQAHHDLRPEKLIYDKAAGTGKWHAEVAKATDEQTQLVAPLVAYEQRSKRFGPDNFTLSQDGQSLTCPNGQTSTIAYHYKSSQGRVFRFYAKQCAGCPLTEACRGAQAQPGRMRQVFISDHRSTLARARTYAQTPAFLEDLRQRATIERLIANLVRYHGARHARRRGRSWCDYQAKMSAMAFNIRQWLRQLERRRGLAEGSPA